MKSRHFLQQCLGLGKQSREKVGHLLAPRSKGQSLSKNQFIIKPAKGFMSTADNSVTLLEGLCI